MDFETHSQAVTEFADALGGYDRVRLEENLEAVDGRCAGC